MTPRPDVGSYHLAATKVALGLLLHLGVLLVPVLVVGAGRLASLDVILALIGMSALCLADLAGASSRPSPLDARLPMPVAGLAFAEALGLLAVFWTGLWGRLAGATPAPASLVVLGAALMLVGAGLRYAAVRTLGASFVTAVHAGPQLVRRGVYRRMRHPSETGLLVAAFGASLLLASPAALVLLALWLLPVVVLRTRREDAVLSAAFGFAHRAYLREAGRFLPR